jgi:glycosyltransferase involved in cell wall biosynthesis
MILYFGNILSASGNTPSFIEILGPRLASLTEIKLASDKKGQVARMLDMIFVFFRHQRKDPLILIDTYSYRGFYYAVVIGWFARRFGRKYIPIIRGGDFKRRFSIRRGLTRKLLDHAHAIVVPSIYIQEVLNREGYEPVFIPNFMDIANYTFQIRLIIRPRLLWVRSFHKIYDPTLAIRILHELSQQFNDATLCMVGPDRDDTRRACEQLIDELNLRNKVELTGKLSKSEWAEKSKGFDIFINTALIDNHPVSVMEAMLLGLPVVSSRVGGIPYLLKEGEEGLLAESGNVGDFTSAIRQLIEHPDKANTLSQRARAKAEGYDWPVIREKWIALLHLR